MVSITHSHGWLDDGGSAALWDQENPIGIGGADCSISSVYGDYLDISGLLDSGVADDEFVFYGQSVFNGGVNVDHTIYNYYMIRYKTSEGSNGLAARVQLSFADATSETILGGGSGVFSQAWTVATGTIAKTTSSVDNVWLWAIENGDGAGTHHVYYDFILLSQQPFTFPNVGNHVNFDSSPRNIGVSIPSRVGDVPQNLGSPSATVDVSCDLERGNWKRAGDLADGQVFLDIAHYSTVEPWQWLNIGDKQFKVTLESCSFQLPSSSRTLDLTFKECRVSNAALETPVERFGLNL